MSVLSKIFDWMTFKMLKNLSISVKKTGSENAAEIYQRSSTQFLIYLFPEIYIARLCICPFQIWTIAL